MVAVLIVPETGGKPALLLLIAPRALMVIIFIIQVLEIYAFQRAQAVLMLVEALAQIALLTVVPVLLAITALHVAVVIYIITVHVFHRAQAVLMLVEALAQIVLLTVLLALPVFTVLHVVVEIIYIIVPAFHPALVPPMLLVLVV